MLGIQSELLMVRSDCAAGSFQVAVQKRNGPYHCQAVPVRCELFLLFVIVSTELVANGAITPVFLFFI